MLKLLDGEAALEELDAFFEKGNRINGCRSVRIGDGFNDAGEYLGGVTRDISGGA